jgi:4-hydroxybutyrate dehydrogenase
MALINYLTRIQFEAGAVAQLAEECALLGICRPLVVTDRGVRGAGLVDQVLAPTAGKLATAIFDETPSNPTEAAVKLGVAAYRAHDADAVIAIGGGSAMDLAKGVALAATHPGPLKDYAVIEGGVGRITSAVAPVIAIPTTAGTGSEVGRGAIIILDDKRKLGILSPYLIPKVAICDPELTIGLPAMLTAATGMDALSHCIETFLAAAFNPPADGIAMDGLTRGWAAIELAVREPTNMLARRDMMAASMQGAMAFQKGLGCIHSLSHSLGGIDSRLHHGTLNAVLLPAVLRFNAAAPTVVVEKRMDRLAQGMGLADGGAVIPAIQALNSRLGIPSGLGAMGVTQAIFPQIIKGALADHCHRTNPREASEADYREMLANSM